MSAIAEKAMLVAVHISIWTARKHDRAVSKEVALALAENIREICNADIGLG